MSFRRSTGVRGKSAYGAGGQYEENYWGSAGGRSAYMEQEEPFSFGSGRGVKQSVGGYLDENPSFGGGYGQEDYYESAKPLRKGRGQFGGDAYGGEAGYGDSYGGTGDGYGMGGGRGGRGRGHYAEEAEPGNSSLVALLKKQSDVINKLTEKIGVDYEEPYGGEYYEPPPSYGMRGRGGPRGRGGYDPRGRGGYDVRGRGGFGPGGMEGYGRGGMGRGSPGKRRGDYSGDFGGKRPRMDMEGPRRGNPSNRPSGRAGYAVNPKKDVTSPNDQNKPKRKTATAYRKFLRKENAMRLDDGSFPPYTEGSIIGVNFIKPVDGYYCKLCKRFFNTEAEGTLEHCMSRPHYEQLKDAQFGKKDPVTGKRVKPTQEAETMEDTTMEEET